MLSRLIASSSMQALGILILMLDCLVIGVARNLDFSIHARGRERVAQQSNDTNSSRRQLINTRYFQQKAIANYIVVDQYGYRGFKTIQSAIDHVPSWSPTWICIHVNAGIYNEKVVIPYDKPNIIIQGEGKDSTIITWGDTATTAYGTANSATFTVWASNFTARGVSFKNSAAPPPPGAKDRQAVAVLVAGDMASFYFCGFYGAQDTLFDYQGRHYFKNCYIEGSIDFIFGHGQSIYKGCDLHAIAQTAGSITAQNREDPQDPSGFIFLECAITGTGDVYLGRAWGAYSRVIFIRSYFSNIILPEGWQDWSIPSREQTVYYGQYKCSGPGANLAGRVYWSRELSDEEAQRFLHISFINGQWWLDEA
ncbi:hypothetical protein O6H91_01G103200 [Diphasiastrum complanatum]|uniref:Uncharacterized protein n=1 Tax=Diphasiastrum complanatum TaxID=34168 RepID=A0ACC2EU64_DIPCM|nr:hypothetical protein O6H91_01G103200 [Diphasiastrum complanatum]